MLAKLLIISQVINGGGGLEVVPPSLKFRNNGVLIRNKFTVARNP